MKQAAKIFLLLMLIVIWPASGPAQMFQCPPGSTAVSGGGGMMCQCPDGSYAGMSGCRAVSRPQYLPPQQTDIAMLQRRIAEAKQRNYVRAKAPAFNRATRKWEGRQGLNVVTRLGGKIWYQTLDYDGARYVYADFLDAFVEIGDNYEAIYQELSSGDPDQISAAGDQIEEIAGNQGLTLPQGLQME